MAKLAQQEQERANALAAQFDGAFQEAPAEDDDQLNETDDNVAEFIAEEGEEQVLAVVDMASAASENNNNSVEEEAKLRAEIEQERARVLAEEAEKERLEEEQRRAEAEKREEEKRILVSLGLCCVCMF